MFFSQYSRKLACVVAVMAATGTAALAGEGIAHVKDFANGFGKACEAVAGEVKPMCYDMHVIHDHSNCWARPTKVPHRRVPVVYQQYYPQAWYGTGMLPMGEMPRPMVYQPTDTTQLGFTYHRVPQWQPNPGMLPRPPYPPEWHHRICHPHGGHVHSVNGPVIYESAMPMQMTPTPAPSPTPLPEDGPNGVPPAPAPESLNQSASTAPFPGFRS